ncbi:hypothetical protein C0992_004781, partial [Termitomyces sp. T32_za158]
MDIAMMPTPEGYLRWKDWAGRPFFLLTEFDSEGLYHEAIVDYNAAYPLTPLSPLNWMDVQLQPPHFDAATAINIMDADVLRAMLANCIPVEWVDHAYTFSMVYLETHFFEVNASINIYREMDNDRHRRLDLYGEPPAIPQWDDWQ